MSWASLKLLTQRDEQIKWVCNLLRATPWQMLLQDQPWWSLEPRWDISHSQVLPGNSVQLCPFPSPLHRCLILFLSPLAGHHLTPQHSWISSSTGSLRLNCPSKKSAHRVLWRGKRWPSFYPHSLGGHQRPEALWGRSPQVTPFVPAGDAPEDTPGIALTEGETQRRGQEEGSKLDCCYLHSCLHSTGSTLLSPPTWPSIQNRKRGMLSISPIPHPKAKLN